MSARFTQFSLKVLSDLVTGRCSPIRQQESYWTEEADHRPGTDRGRSEKLCVEGSKTCHRLP